MVNNKRISADQDTAGKAKDKSVSRNPRRNFMKSAVLATAAICATGAMTHRPGREDPDLEGSIYLGRRYRWLLNV